MVILFIKGKKNFPDIPGCIQFHQPLPGMIIAIPV